MSVEIALQSTLVSGDHSGALPMWRAVQFTLRPPSADNARATTHRILVIQTMPRRDHVAFRSEQCFFRPRPLRSFLRPCGSGCSGKVLELRVVVVPGRVHKTYNAWNTLRSSNFGLG